MGRISPILESPGVAEVVISMHRGRRSGTGREAPSDPGTKRMVCITRVARRGQCGISIMFQLRLAIIQIEPTMTRNTISTPKARARMLFV